MKFFVNSALAAAVLLAGTAVTYAQDKPTAEVIHWWTTGGESAAVQALAAEYDKAGGVWVDSAVAGGDNARAVAVNRMVGGNPPAAVQFNIGKQFDDLVDQGLLRDLDAIADAEGWRDVLPKPILDSISRNGHIYAAPINIHGQNWMWYSMPAFKQAGIETPPANWDEVITDMEKLKAAGLVPLALNGGLSHITNVFNNIVLSKGGRDIYLKVFADQDPEAVRSPEFRSVVETFAKLRDFVDEGVAARNWNDATAMVIQDTAGMQFLGDWAKGEFNVAGEVVDTDYGCIVGPGTTNYVIGGDVFIFPKLSDENQIAGQELLARTMLSPEAQIAFSLNKGSIPARTDVDMSSFDKCAQLGASYVADAANQLPATSMLISADKTAALSDVILKIFFEPEFTVDQFVEDFADILQSDY